MHTLWTFISPACLLRGAHASKRIMVKASGSQREITIMEVRENRRQGRNRKVRAQRWGVRLNPTRPLGTILWSQDKRSSYHPAYKGNQNLLYSIAFCVIRITGTSWAHFGIGFAASCTLGSSHTQYPKSQEQFRRANRWANSLRDSCYSDCSISKSPNCAITSDPPDVYWSDQRSASRAGGYFHFYYIL